MVLHVVCIGQLVPETRRLIRLHGRTAGPLHQQARKVQRLVADHLRGQPQPRSTRQQAVLGIALEASRPTREACRYVALVTIVRSNPFMSQPELMSSTASQSSSSG